ncbi:DNA repair and recombination protein RAD5C [Lasiosphaeria ovina]|uniref:DNA repair and recombination protein RAD5C n=1 Tax=Lasiosphaeria ovina TaxID=92902 RepID=A0AAE0KAT3_9PEZI|nr:DNA repair and recombination protein RAD5C [Lasiosphaeria ovina]
MATRGTRILTPLFQHQQEALDFMIRREAQSTSEEAVTRTPSRSQEDFVFLASHIGTGRGTATTSKATMVIVPSERKGNTFLPLKMIPQLNIVFQFFSIHGQRKLKGLALPSRPGCLQSIGEDKTAVFFIRSAGFGRYWMKTAHTIRNWSSKQLNAVCSISSQARWCLTGTPVQNSLDGLGSLIKFLRMPIFSETATSRNYATKAHYSEGATHGELGNLQLILSSICLRRNKTVLPKREHKFETCKPAFTAQERREYRGLELACKRAIAIGAKGLGDEKTHQMVMEALLRLRMFCNNGSANPGSIMSSALKPSRPPDETLSLLQQSGEALCAHCSVDILCIGNASSNTNSGCFTPCGRLLFGDCYVDSYRSGHRDCKPFVCSLCHGDHDVDNWADGESVAQGAGEKKWPSKTTAIVQNVQTHYLANKCVIFSFWKTTLGILGAALEARKIGYLRVDGDVPAKKRNAIVLLMTFSTGGVGLNGLTVANMVHIVEPQWNPAVENQAIGRVLRLDQQRKVTIFRYAMQRSIEEVVQSRQLRKLQLASRGFRLSQEGKRQLKSNPLQRMQECLDASGLEEAQ